MKVQSSIFIAFTLFLSTLSYGQSGYFEDALRFSQNVPAGSARMIGIGGTQWSLGGDVSNIAGNPAGLGFFRKSEASITFGYSDWRVDTQYLGQPRQYNTSNFSIPNLSVVFASPKGPLNRGAFKGGSFGISIQRIANFNTEYGFFSDEIGSTSIIDFYLQNAIGVPESQIPGLGLTGLAYNTYLINPLLDSNGNAIPGEYDPVIGFEIGAFQDENITQEGNASQITFSYGANFNHKLFVGGSLGIRSLNFASRKVYNEEFAEGPLFNTSLRENLFINGTGVNLNLGLIYKPIDQLNLGFNFQSPTWYSLNEEYDARIIAEFDNFYYAPEDITLRREEAATDFILSSYGLNSPLKVGAGATFFLGKNGFISADVDYVDFSAARLNSNDFNEGPDNQAIRDFYTSTLNFRLGGEARLDIFRIRAGFAHFGDPYSNSNFDRSMQQYSGGFGARLNNFTIDFAVVNRRSNGLYNSYQVLDQQGNNIGPFTELNNSIFSGVLTLGITF